MDGLKAGGCKGSGTCRLDRVGSRGLRGVERGLEVRDSSVIIVTRLHPGLGYMLD